MPPETPARKIGGVRMPVAVIGCNHRTASVELRERVVFTPEQALRAVDELRARGIVEEAVVLSTCNRSELYGVPASQPDFAPDAMEHYFTAFHRLGAEEVTGRMFRHAGRDAVQHLFRVAAGLDSMLLGEAEILGQVREAYGRALDHGSTGPVLNRVFQGALEVGKRVRSETEVGARPMSVALAGVKLAERVFGELEGHEALIVGAGAVAEQVIEHLKNRGIGKLRVVNRSVARAAELARRMGAETGEWSSLDQALESPDIVVTSVAEAGTVVNRGMLERALEARSGRAMFLVDLGVPRNIEAAAAKLYNVYVYNLDDLGEIVEQNRKSREAEIPRAEALIAEQLGKFEVWQNSVEAAFVLEQLRERLHREREAFLAERWKSGAAVSTEDRERQGKLTEDLIERILKGPGRRLRNTRELRQRLEDAEVLRDLFGLSEDDDEDRS